MLVIRNAYVQKLEDLAESDWIAHASSYETETQLIISNNLNYLTIKELDEIIEKINEWQKMSYTFQLKLKAV